MKEKIYLVPLFYASNGKLPLSYEIIRHKKDMRYNFCKRNVNYCFDSIEEIKGLYGYSRMRIDESDNNLLYAPNMKIAFNFHHSILKQIFY